MIYTTLAEIRAKHPCPDGWEKLLRHMGIYPHHEPIAFSEILKSNGLRDAAWCLCTVAEPVFCRKFAVACMRRVQHLMKDPRSLAALDVAERHADGLATDEELRDAAAHAHAAYASSSTASAYAAAASTSTYAASTYAAYAAYAAAAAYAYAAAYAAASAAGYAAGPADATDATDIFAKMLEEHNG